MNKEQKPQERESEGVIAFLRGWWEKTFVKAGLTLFAFIVLVLAGLWRFASPDVAKFAAYLIGGLALICQIYISGRRVAAAEETAQAMQKTVELQERGNIAEQFKNAVEHLGHESSSIRLGGIYALHHIAQEVEEYRERVFEILCAHVRATTAHTAYISIIEEFDQKRPTIEIQSILNLLFIEPLSREIYKNLSANLQNANLSWADLNDANLQNSNLSRAILDNAYLLIADLQEANLSYTSIQNANLFSTNLKGATLYLTNLQNSEFRSANLREANTKLFNKPQQELKQMVEYGRLIANNNLTIEQLLEAKTLYKAKLPEGMGEEIRKRKPELLEKPADEPAN